MRVQVALRQQALKAQHIHSDAVRVELHTLTAGDEQIGGAGDTFFYSLAQTVERLAQIIGSRLLG